MNLKAMRRARALQNAGLLTAVSLVLATRTFAAPDGSLPTVNERFGFAPSITSRGSFGTDLVTIADGVGYQGLAIGSPTNASNQAGAVSRWRDTGGGWQENTPATVSPSTASGDRFGANLASFGSRLMVTESNPPELHIYDVVPNTLGDLSLAQSLLPQLAGAPGNRLGLSLATFADYAAVGNLRNFENSGSVELFRLVAGQWASTGQLLTSPGATLPVNAAFGHAMVMTEDRLFVGTPYFDPISGEVLPGDVWEYTRPSSGSSWTLSFVYSFSFAQVPTNQPAEFGYSVDAQGTLMVAGAPGAKLADGGDAIGAVAVYEFDGGAGGWVNRALLSNPDAEAGARFGAAVAVRGSDILVSAPAAESGDGRAYLFERTAVDQWHPRLRLSSSVVGNDDFGRSVTFAANGSYVVGAPQFGSYGAFYVFLPDDLLSDGFE